MGRAPKYEGEYFPGSIGAYLHRRVDADLEVWSHEKKVWQRLPRNEVVVGDRSGNLFEDKA